MGKVYNQHKERLRAKHDYLQSEIDRIRKLPNNELNRVYLETYLNDQAENARKIRSMPDYIEEPKMKNKSKMSAPIPAPAPKSKGLSIPQILGLLMFIYIAAAVFGGQKTCEGLVGSPEVCKTVQSFLPY